MKSTKQATPAKVRRMTICNKGNVWQGNECIRLPAVLLSGKWMQAYGFRPGHVIDIACKKGRLVITIAKEQRFEGI